MEQTTRAHEDGGRTRSRYGALALALVLAAFGMTGRALADGGETCDRVALTERGELPPAWREAARRLREEILHLPASECRDVAWVVISAEAAGVRLVVTSSDGRRAERSVRQPSSLTTVALGMLASIPPEEARADAGGEDGGAAKTAAPRELVDASVDASLDASIDALPEASPRRPPPAAAAQERAFQIAIGVSTGGRFGAPTRAIAPEFDLRGDARINGWIVALNGRVAPIGARTGGARVPGFDFKDFGFGVSGGRRMSLDGWPLDLTIGPTLEILTVEGDVPVDGAGGTSVDFWVQAGARLVFPYGDRLRPTVGFDVGVAPFLLDAAPRVEALLPPVPTWSMALRAGVAGDVL